VIYVFDSGPLIVLFRHYYPERFPSLWQRFARAIGEGTIVSVREVSREIEGIDDRLSAWARRSVVQKHLPHGGGDLVRRRRPHELSADS
jgi:hypothetical protein